MAVICLAVTGCDLRLLNPSGDAPLRYRDEVFSGVTKTPDLTYGSAVDQYGVTQALKLDMYRPTGDTVANRPAIVWVHGGSFSSGSKTSPELVDESNTFARKGYVNVSINYRLSHLGCIPVSAECITAIRDAWHDAQAAVRFLRANAATYGVDPTRIAIGGSSAGAITALNVLYGPDEVGSSGNPGYASTVRAAVSLSGASILTTPDPGEGPALFFHSTRDPLVSFSWAASTYYNATKAGDHAELTTWDEATHVPYAQHRDQIVAETTNFLWYLMDIPHADT